MKTVTVNTRKPYDVIIDRGILMDVGTILHGKLYRDKATSSSKVMVVATEDVKAYVAVVKESLDVVGYASFVVYLPSGEVCKTFEYAENLLVYLDKYGFQREDILLTVGGGSVGDTAGFAASIYKHGMRLVHVPTTLLAMVDSAIGGKTAVNFRNGKNMVGSFYQPDLVIEDVDTLLSMDGRNMRSGVGELIKYGVLDKNVFYKLFSEITVKNVDELVVECVEIKAKYVEADEFDMGIRHFMNLGHTIGHAIELLSGFKTPHGLAVANGVMAIARCSDKAFGTSVAPQIKRVLGIQKIDDELTYSVEDILAAVTKDKKWSFGKLTVIVIDDIGKCRLCDFTENEFSDFIRGGLIESKN
jgi:3-dehydroquinate synthetase